MKARRIVVIACVCIIAAATASGRPKTDIVYLNNGDRFTGEIKGLERGKLKLKTDHVGTILVEWPHVSHVESAFLFTVEDERGTRYVGGLTGSTEAGKLDVAGALTTDTLATQGIVSIRPLEESFWQGLKGAMDMGYSFTQASKATQWSAHVETKYQSRNYLTTVNYTSILKNQKGAARVNRHAANGSLSRLLGERWLALGLARFLSNESQGLDLRSTFGVAGGRRILQTNRTFLLVAGGLAATNEKNRTAADTWSAELLGTLLFEAFRFDSPELDITTAVYVYPSLTTPGRVRIDLEAGTRFELVKDFYWNLTLFDNYDNRPPGLAGEKNDFGITTSLGWSF